MCEHDAIQSYAFRLSLPSLMRESGVISNDKLLTSDVTSPDNYTPFMVLDRSYQLMNMVY